MGRVGTCDGWRFLQLYSRLNLKSRPASLHFFALFYLLYFLDVGVWIINLDNLEVWRGLGRGVLRNLSLLKKSLLIPRFMVISDLCGIDELIWWTIFAKNFEKVLRISRKSIFKKIFAKTKEFFLVHLFVAWTKFSRKRLNENLETLVLTRF